MTDNDDSGVAEIKPALRAAPIQIERLGRSCFQHPLWIDDLSGKVFCRVCKHQDGRHREISPLEALKQIAQEWDTHVGWADALRRDEKRLREEVEDLKRQRRNLKAQARRFWKHEGLPEFERQLHEGVIRGIYCVLEASKRSDQNALASSVAGELTEQVVAALKAGAGKR